jgi:NAD(P)-dependent dehydrogenase (short-subunit alcohol dehydrogenase family)
MAAKNALIVGASRGLGLGLVDGNSSHDGWQVTATVRDPGSVAEALKKRWATCNIEQLDHGQPCKPSGHPAAKSLSAHVFDLVFVNAGIKGPDDQTSGARQPRPTSANCS